MSRLILLRSILRIPISLQENTATPQSSLKWSILSSAYKSTRNFNQEQVPMLVENY